MRTSTSRVAVLSLIFASACGPEQKNREVTHSCSYFQSDGGTSTATYGAFVICDVTPEQALGRCQDLPVPTINCVSIGRCTCVLGRDTGLICD